MNDSTPLSLRWADLPELFPGFPGPGRWLPLLQRHADLVASWRTRINLTAVDPLNAVRRNYAESLEVWRIACELIDAGVAADVGSGAGFPGMVAAAVAPDCRFHLVEPTAKRSNFLAEAARELALDNVEVHALRAEEVGRTALREQADVVLARAVAALPELLEYAAPLARVGGFLVLPKGRSVSAELAAAAHAAQVLGLSPPRLEAMRGEVSDTPWVAIFPKADATPETYPRRPGVPGRRPLQILRSSPDIRRGL